MDWLWKGNPALFDLPGSFQDALPLHVHPWVNWGPVRYNRDRIRAGDILFLMDAKPARPGQRLMYAAGVVAGSAYLETTWDEDHDRTDGAQHPGWYYDSITICMNRKGIYVPADIDRRSRHSDRGQRATPTPLTRDERVELLTAFNVDSDTVKPLGIIA